MIILMYALVEDSVVAHFLRINIVDESLKKFGLLSFGINTLLLTAANILLFLGSVLKQERTLLMGAWTIFGMCVLIISLAIGAPGMCFFAEELCVIKHIRSGTLGFIYLCVTVFLWIWLYFMLVIFQHLNNVM